MAAGHPTDFSKDMMKKAKAYLASCKDKRVFKRVGRRYVSGLDVRIPTRGGMAVALGVARDTLYEWAKVHKEFSDIMEELGSIQEGRLIENGLSGDYNSTIAKVLLTKHGYREGIEATGADGKDLIPSDELDKKAGNSVKKFLGKVKRN